MFSLFFSLVLFSASDFFFAYLALEGMSFSLYVLSVTVFYNKQSLESAIKYFILGGISSGLLLYALAILFFSINSLDFFSVKFFLTQELY
jgi:NADH-quinone oxidoreductase subunit N